MDATGEACLANIAPSQPVRILAVEDMQKIGGYEEDLVEQLSKDYECPVCLLLLRDPHLTQCCGTHFCESCIKPVAFGSDKCPMCTQKIGTLMLNKRMQRSVGDLKIFCPNKADGCQWEGELRYKQDHLDQQCQFILVQCKYDCGQRVLRSDYQHHLEDVCAKRPLEVQLNSLSRLFDTKIKQLEEEVVSTKRECRDSVKSLEDKLALQMVENSMLKQQLRDQKAQLEEFNNATMESCKQVATQQEKLKKANEQINLLSLQFGPVPTPWAERSLGANPRGSGDNSTPDNSLLGSIGSTTVVEQGLLGTSPSSMSYQNEEASLSGTSVCSPGLPRLQEELDMLGVQISLLRESHWKFKEQSSRRLRAVTNELAIHYQLMKELDLASNSKAMLED